MDGHGRPQKAAAAAAVSAAGEGCTCVGTDSVSLSVRVAVIAPSESQTNGNRHKLASLTTSTEEALAAGRAVAVISGTPSVAPFNSRVPSASSSHRVALSVCGEMWGDVGRCGEMHTFGVVVP